MNGEVDRRSSLTLVQTGQYFPLPSGERPMGTCLTVVPPGRFFHCEPGQFEEMLTGFTHSGLIGVPEDSINAFGFPDKFRLVLARRSSGSMSSITPDCSLDFPVGVGPERILKEIEGKNGAPVRVALVTNSIPDDLELITGNRYY